MAVIDFASYPSHELIDASSDARVTKDAVWLFPTGLRHEADIEAFPYKNVAITYKLDATRHAKIWRLRHTLQVAKQKKTPSQGDSAENKILIKDFNSNKTLA